jgi:hypothetical protein
VVGDLFDRKVSQASATNLGMMQQRQFLFRSGRSTHDLIILGVVVVIRTAINYSLNLELAPKLTQVRTAVPS